MFIDVTTELPDILKRGFISNTDRAMVYQDVDTGSMALAMSTSQFRYTYEANFYHQSNIFSRMMAREVHKSASAVMVAAGDYTRLHDRLLAGDESAWRVIVLHTEGAGRYRKLVRRCYAYIESTGDCFGLLPMLKRYWLDVLGENEVFFKAFVGGAGIDDNPSIYELNRLLETATFRALPESSRETWGLYLANYVKDVKSTEKLIAVRDHGVELVAERGANYEFIVTACRELLL